MRVSLLGERKPLRWRLAVAHQRGSSPRRGIVVVWRDVPATRSRRSPAEGGVSASRGLTSSGIGGTRTHIALFVRQVLSQLSYEASRSTAYGSRTRLAWLKARRPHR